MSGGPDGDGWTNQSPANHRRLPRGESGSARCLKETRKSQESYLDIELNVKFYNDVTHGIPVTETCDFRLYLFKVLLDLCNYLCNY